MARFNINESSTIKDYSFSNFQVSENESCDVKTYELKEFDNSKVANRNIPDKVIRRERVNEAKSEFKIDTVVKKDRGLDRQAEEDYQKKVQIEVDRRLIQIKEEAYNEGYAKGEERGSREALEKATIEYDDRINKINAYVDEVLSYKKNLLENQREDIFQMVKSLTKWILLKEIKDDTYIVALLEKLILELHTKTDLMIKVNESSFDQMPDVLTIIREKLGDLSNVRLEIDRDMKHPGIILESKNGIIDGSIEAQFQNIDKLFEGIGITPE